MPLHRMLNLVYVWCIARLSQGENAAQRVEEWKMDLMAPLNPDAPPTEAELEAEGDVFMDSLAKFGGGK